MPEKNSQSGYTLIELVIATMLMVAVFSVFGAFLLKFTRASAEINETVKVNEDVEASVALLRTELERTGRNLSVQDDQPFAGKLPVPFVSHSDYQTSDGVITRQTSSSSVPVESAVRFRGNGFFHFAGINFTATVRELADSPRSWAISRVFNAGGIGFPGGGYETINVYENGVVKATVQNFNVLNKASVDVQFASTSSSCTAAFLVNSQVIYQSSHSCASFFKQVYVEMPVGNQISEFELTGSEVIRRTTDTDSVRLALLPFYENARMTSPLILSSDGFVILGGESRQDPLVLAQNATFIANQTAQPATVNDASSIAAGDVLLICDFFNNRSVMLNIIGKTGNTLSAQPIYAAGQMTRGFEKLYLPSSDFSSFVFQRGVRVVKLSSPVEYRVATNENTSGLYRRTAGSAWQLVLPNIANFSFTQNIRPSDTSFEVSFDLVNEGVDTTQRTQKVHFSINPRALNRTFDVR